MRIHRLLASRLLGTDLDASQVNPVTVTDSHPTAHDPRACGCGSGHPCNGPARGSSSPIQGVSLDDDADSTFAAMIECKSSDQVDLSTLSRDQRKNNSPSSLNLISTSSRSDQVASRSDQVDEASGLQVSHFDAHPTNLITWGRALINLTRSLTGTGRGFNLISCMRMRNLIAGDLRSESRRVALISTAKRVGSSIPTALTALALAGLFLHFTFAAGWVTPAGAVAGVGQIKFEHVTKRQFEKESGAWPLTVRSGTLSCEPTEVSGVLAVHFITDGKHSKEYGLNGSATSRGAPKINPIWAKDRHGTRMSIGALIARGLALCGLSTEQSAGSATDRATTVSTNTRKLERTQVLGNRVGVPHAYGTSEGRTPRLATRQMPRAATASHARRGRSHSKVMV